MTAGQQIIDLSRHLWGKARYVFGAEVGIPRNPVDFVWYDAIRQIDCSEYTQATFGAFGIYLPDGSGNQADYLKVHRISIGDAAHTPGALLGHYPSGGRPGHVVMAVGDGVHTSEARGVSYGVGSWGIARRPFTWAAKVPDLTGAPPSGSLAELARALFFAKQFRLGAPSGPGVLNETSPGGPDAVKFLQAGLNHFFADFARLTHQSDPPDLPVNGVWDVKTQQSVTFLQHLIGHIESGTGPETWKALYP